jgi:hypothetical protein
VELFETYLAAAGGGRVGLEGTGDKAELEVAFPDGTSGHDDLASGRSPPCLEPVLGVAAAMIRA